MNSDQPIRRVTVKLSAREKEDPVVLLAVVRECLRAKNVHLSVRARQEKIPAPAVRPDEQLEQSARSLVKDALDRVAAEIIEKKAASDLGTEERVAEIVAIRQGNVARIKYWLSRSVGITLKTYETVVTKVENVAGALFSKGK